MSGDYVSRLKSGILLVVVGTYAWLLSISAAVTRPTTLWFAWGALAALWLGFFAATPSFRRLFCVFGFVLLSGAALALGESDAPPLRWFELVGWFGFAAVSASDSLPESLPRDGLQQRLEPRRALPRSLLLVPFAYGGLGLGLWAFGAPLEVGAKSALLLLALLAGGLFLLRAGGSLGMALASSRASDRIPRTQLMRGGIALALIVIWATRQLLPG